MTKFKLSSVPVLTFSVIWTIAGKNIGKKKSSFHYETLKRVSEHRKYLPSMQTLRDNYAPQSIHTHHPIMYNAQITAEEKKKLSLLLKYLTALSRGLLCCEPPPAAGSSFTPNSQKYDLYGLLTQATLQFLNVLEVHCC